MNLIFFLLIYQFKHHLKSVILNVAFECRDSSIEKLAKRKSQIKMLSLPSIASNFDGEKSLFITK